jgi:hypothetical protein
MPTLEEFFQGTHRNSLSALVSLPKYAEVLRAIDDAFEKGLSHLGSTTHEGTALFAAMSHAAFLSAVQLAASGQLPPSYMVTRGCVEDAIYAFFLYHHTELKGVWSARQASSDAKKKVRAEFTIVRMKRFLAKKNTALAEQFEIVYDATIDLGAHPNALGAYSHLIALESGDFEWQYINTTRVDRTFALRVAAMGGVFALNIFRELFPVNFVSTGASDYIDRAHDMLLQLPEPQQEALAAADT